MEVKVTITNNVTANLEEFKKLSKMVAKDAYDFFVQATPKGDPSTWNSGKAPSNYIPGNARRSTTLQGTTIQADYPYAERLNQGWSNQAPKGMVEPLLNKLPEIVNKRVDEIKRGQK